MSRTPARINEILAYDPNPRIEWAVNQHPRQAMCASLSVTPTQYHWQSQPAIEPHSVRSITIRLKPFDRDRPIVVLPTQGVMTVGEVLHAVYSGARAGATEMFCNASGVLPLLMESRLSDYSQLAIHSSGPKMGEDEVSSDVCSCLNFKTRWAGLTPSTTESDVWILHTLPIS
ncbi:hypothetical protein B0H34DRAFT_716102 [Crassisporium funariophilum]|nr:hypothetical protein B0H34DRAFT_716102 [Crassisporium funariophilum]